MDYPSRVENRPFKRPGFALQIGVLFGIPIRIHLSFLLLLIWFGIDQQTAGANLLLALLQGLDLAA